jgi:predicted dehydrogenase
MILLNQEHIAMSKRWNRRRFLQVTALSGIGYWIVTHSGANENKSPNERIAIAGVGLGKQGSSDIKEVSKLGDIVAICDVDETQLNTTGYKRFPKAKRYTDFRKMFEEMGKSIDAVTVSTPDHAHAAIALMAMRMGKHCYCQKPLAHNLYEARLMAKVAGEMKVATQMGNQKTAETALRKTVAVIQSGVLGAPKEVHVWTNRPIWPQGNERPMPADCPNTLNWDLWIGPAPLRPYAKGYHPYAWRGLWDFGSGALGDMACHTLNTPFWALDLRDPIWMQAETSGHNKDSYPASSKIVYQFAATDKRPAVKLHWYDGGNLPDENVIGEMYGLYKNEIMRDKNHLISGCIVVGEKDTLYIPGDYAEKTTKLSGDKPLPEVNFDKSPGHFQEWIRAIESGEPAKSNFADYAGPLTETVLLGNLAVWTADKSRGEKVKWDSKNLQCTNIEGLEPLIKPAYRAGYMLDV